MKRIAIGLVVLLLVGFIGVQLAVRGVLGSPERRGDVHEQPVPAAVIAERQAIQTESAEVAGVAESKQILFGDFHVHTTFSFDAFMMNMPMTGGTGSHPPADACDFARYCSGLDFWSINDHAENLTQRLWTETVEMVRHCNAVAGDPANPDLVTYLGWEWSQIGSRPDNHYGHKNVVLLETDEGRIPVRPIGSRGPATDGAPAILAAPLIAINGKRGLDFALMMNDMINAERCPSGVPVRELPLDCLEGTVTPEELFTKLRDWDLPTLVIPHGTAWGMYTPAGSDWAKQLPGSDEGLQTLVEVFSGHGNSERYFDWRAVRFDADGTAHCPEPLDGYLPSCWRAGELLEERCKEVGESDEVCAERAEVARQNYVDAYQAGWKTLPGHKADSWLDSGQCPDCFLPAFNYRPLGSVQYMLAIRDFSVPDRPKRFSFGLLGSSDNHSARPGTGYKEFARGDMSDGARPGASPPAGAGLFGAGTSGERVAESVPYVDEGGSPLQLFETGRAGNFMATGGLVAVHSAGRDRQAIWDALQRKEVYGTSGPRLLLWFDLLDETEAGEAAVPMGSSTKRRAAPRFSARALGSFKQQSGCPPHSVDALGRDRIDQLCLGDCYFPSDVRRVIERIEVVRIQPQAFEGEPIGELVRDPWQVFECPGTPDGCSVEFEDPEFEQNGRDAVYYIRAIEEPSPVIHAENLGCSRDESGNCLRVSPCNDGDCLGEAQQRAWSSPIFVDWDATEALSEDEALASR
jgi:hypothetical protein